jgi:hypothetical protein
VKEAAYTIIEDAKVSLEVRGIEDLLAIAAWVELGGCTAAPRSDGGGPGGS